MTRDGKADKGHDWLDTWKAMEDLYLAYPEKLKAIGKPRTSAWRYITHVFLLGVSNFSVEFLERLLKVARVIPAANQIELHP